ncbi:MAG: LytTR family DNA-binding domain-containing protein [Rhizobiaceae bacterium]
MSDTPLQFTKRELQIALSRPRLWAGLVGASLLLGLVGPFGTFDSLPLLPRVAYWTAIAILTYATGLATVYFAVAALFRPNSTNPFAYLVAGALAGIPVAIIVCGLNNQLFGDPATWGEALELSLYCIAIAAVVSLLVAVFTIPQEGAAAQAEAANFASAAALAAPVAGSPPPDMQRPAILDRLPVEKRGRLAYMSMQDHYVDVHTDRGGTLVLMRLADAITETQGVSGLQVHRSHWVALDAVAAAVRREGRLFLRMVDGTELPVSRPYMAAVRAAGLGK